MSMFGKMDLEEGTAAFRSASMLQRGCWQRKTSSSSLSSTCPLQLISWNRLNKRRKIKCYNPHFTVRLRAPIQEEVYHDASAVSTTFDQPAQHADTISTSNAACGLPLSRQLLVGDENARRFTHSGIEGGECDRTQKMTCPRSHRRPLPWGSRCGYRHLGVQNAGTATLGPNAGTATLGFKIRAGYGANSSGPACSHLGQPLA